MNTKAILTWLTLAGMIAASACVPGATPIGGETATEAPATEEPAATEAPSAQAPLEFPPPEAPSLPLEDKPSLAFSQPVESIGPGATQQIIAYTFPASSPDWTIPIKAAPYTEVKLNPEGLTPVGMVEIASGSASGQPEPGIYEVVIDLGSTEPVVFGQISPVTATTVYDIFFQRIPKILNPARINSPYDQFKGLGPPPDNSAGIRAGSVCFVINIDIPGDDPDMGKVYIGYCSEPGSLLSVIGNFGPQYENLQASMNVVAERFGLQNDLQYDQIISEMEHPERLKGCAEQAEQAQEVVQQACGSDITVAPVKDEYFYEKYDEAKGQSIAPDSRFMIASVLAPVFQQGNGFPVPVAVVQVLQQIETPSGTIQPGEYQMDYWYDAEGAFYAATITGLTAGNIQVTNQPVPAVPATFINEDGTEQPGAQISTCRIFGICTFFQRSCS